MLKAGNVGHMLRCTAERLDELMAVFTGAAGQDRIFHYLPFSFAGSWIALLTCLIRRSQVTINTDLSKIAGDMRIVAPDYFLNVPHFSSVCARPSTNNSGKRAEWHRRFTRHAKAAWARNQDGQPNRPMRSGWRLANSLVFPAIRKKTIGKNLKALICGSAPLERGDATLFHDAWNSGVCRSMG